MCACGKGDGKQGLVTKHSPSDKLPDLLTGNLRLVFVGTAASERSAELKAYYAHPGNRFWSALFEAGITPRRYEPSEFMKLAQLGIGFTDLCKSSSGMDYKIPASEFNVAVFEAKMRAHRPKLIAFTSKNAASIFYRRKSKQISLGRQSAIADFPDIFVLPSPSGAASSHWDLTPWRELAKLTGI
jgi:double-stranded uracil-DNA glycosylase